MALQLIDHPAVPKSTVDDFFIFYPDRTPLKLHCLIMQKISGENLESWIEKHGPISQKLARNWLKQLLEILDITHRSTFFHRDIKPENIIVQPNNQLALIDFGGVQQITDDYLLKVSTNGGTDTAIGTEYKTTAIVTPGYSPLEQINGQALPQSDFYALGRTFVRLVTGKNLVSLKTDPKTGKLIWRNKAPQIDKPFADLLDNLMLPFPGDRPQNTQLILQRLNRLPLQSKINRIIKSNPFKVGAFTLSALAIFGAYTTSRPMIANHFFSKASRNAQNPKVAKKYYELAIKYNPDDVDAYNNLAFTCKQLKDFKCVVNNYKSALKLKPNYWPIYYGLGNFYDENKEYNKASQQYQLAIAKSNGIAAGPINNLSRLGNINGEHRKAKSLALEGLQKTRDESLQAALHKNLGWAFLKEEQHQKAIIHLRKSLEFDSQRADSYCLLAQAQSKLNLTSDAKLSWEACLILDSNLPEVQGWRQQILQRIL